MSDKIRYFRYTKNGEQGAVYPDRVLAPSVANGEQRDVWTEVQVVPSDAIVIRNEPGLAVERITPRGVAAFTDGFVMHAGTDADADYHEAGARRHALLAEYLRAHPPIDEAQVKAVADILTNTGDGGIWEHLGRDNSTEVARRLIASGRVRVETP